MRFWIASLCRPKTKIIRHCCRCKQNETNHSIHLLQGTPPRTISHPTPNISQNTKLTTANTQTQRNNVYFSFSKSAWPQGHQTGHQAVQIPFRNLSANNSAWLLCVTGVFQGELLHEWLYQPLRFWCCSAVVACSCMHALAFEFSFGFTAAHGSLVTRVDLFHVFLQQVGNGSAERWDPHMRSRILIAIFAKGNEGIEMQRIFWFVILFVLLYFFCVCVVNSIWGRSRVRHIALNNRN